MRSDQKTHENQSDPCVTYVLSSVAERSIDTMIATGESAPLIIHDIQNLLSPASLYLKTIEENEKLSPQGVENLHTIQKVIEDIAYITGRLSQKEGFRKPGTYERVPVSDLFREVCRMSQPVWSGLATSHITISSRVEDEQLSVYGVPAELREALVNCMINAADALPDGGHIALEACRKEKMIEIVIRDNGTGMDEETKDRCFDPLFTTKGYKGTGMGLAGAKSIIASHDGTITVHSTEGEGSAFTILLPSPPPSEEMEAEIKENKPQRRLRILCVDDDELVRRSLSDLISRDGHQVITSRNASEALTILEREGPCDAVITDLSMPGSSGYELASAVKHMLPHTPVILLSGWGYRMAKTESPHKDIDYILGKPPKIRELRNILAQLSQEGA